MNSKEENDIAKYGKHLREYNERTHGMSEEKTKMEKPEERKPKLTMLDQFRRPFMSRDTEFKVQTGKESSKAVLAVAYVDARHVQERLNSVCQEYGAVWDNDFREIVVANEIKAVEATVTIKYDGNYIHHADVGSFDNVNEKTHGLKAVYSDAFKRAAVHFGIAVSLYGLPQMWLPNEQQYLKWSAGKARMTNAGEEYLRQTLILYLKDDNNIVKFGFPRQD